MHSAKKVIGSQGSMQQKILLCRKQFSILARISDSISCRNHQVLKTDNIGFLYEMQPLNFDINIFFLNPSIPCLITKIVIGSLRREQNPRLSRRGKLSNP